MEAEKHWQSLPHPPPIGAIEWPSSSSSHPLLPRLFRLLRSKLLHSLLFIVLHKASSAAAAPAASPSSSSASSSSAAAVLPVALRVISVILDDPSLSSSPPHSSASSSSSSPSSSPSSSAAAAASSSSSSSGVDDVFSIASRCFPSNSFLDNAFVSVSLSSSPSPPPVVEQQQKAKVESIVSLLLDAQSRDSVSKADKATAALCLSKIKALVGDEKYFTVAPRAAAAEVSSEESERARRKELAKKKQAAILKKMGAQQRKFQQQMEEENAEAAAPLTSSPAPPRSPSSPATAAAAAAAASSPSSAPTCMICFGEGTVDDPLGWCVLIQRDGLLRRTVLRQSNLINAILPSSSSSASSSSEFSMRCPSGPPLNVQLSAAEERKDQQQQSTVVAPSPSFVGDGIQLEGLTLKACGHAMHMRCHRAYLETQLREVLGRDESEMLDYRQGEFGQPTLFLIYLFSCLSLPSVYVCCGGLDWMID